MNCLLKGLTGLSLFLLLLLTTGSFDPLGLGVVAKIAVSSTLFII